MGFLDLAADLAAVVSASRSVAAKHAALRTRQLGAAFPSAPEETTKDPAETRKASEDASRSESAAAAATPSPQPGRDASPTATAATAAEAGPTETTPVFSDAADAEQHQTSQGPDEPVMPSFVMRTQLRPRVPPSVLHAARRAGAADVVAAAAAAATKNGGSSRPHPLDPRFKQQPYGSLFGANQAAAGTKAAPTDGAPSVASTPKVADAIESDVFRKSSSAVADALSETDRGVFVAGGTEKEKVQEEPASKEPALSATPPPQESAQELSPCPSDESADVGQIQEASTPPTPSPQKAEPEITMHEPQVQPPPVQTSATMPTESMRPAVKGDVQTEADSKVPLPGALPTTETVPRRTYAMKESKVPATRLSRMWNYGGLAAGMLGGALTESISRGFGGGGSGAQTGSVMLSAGNLERLVARLSRMRGAALKLGQMMSFQDAKMLPAPLHDVLQRVQDSADYMPAWQRDRVLAANLGGADWRDLFAEFDETPLAAASIGQVHRATLRSTGAAVAVKIQFPGVADSINSDLDNLGLLLTATRMLPRGLYLDKTLANARTELAWECDYVREAACAQRFRALLADAGELSPSSGGDGDGGVFAVPKIYAEASGKQVLTMSFMEGVGVTRAAPQLTQAQRDWIGTQILRLCLLEITQFRFMQTDPNWTNFLYDARHADTDADTDTGTAQEKRMGTLALLDFGASREYPAAFVDQYVRLLRAAATSDLDAVHALSRTLGYLTGHESRAMLDAHTQSVLTLAEPFHEHAPPLYDFRDQTITDRVRSFIPVMVRERLTPPPEETYSLHRKLSGAFLLCARLGSRVPCRQLFEDSLKKINLS
ncbi:ABC1 protein [Niveomyces insectorum RCEF 264]|uniref:ABC1 protein n=1 Tax=Niveomyces insectorum RCEF 264 TaxID=1081102 RepID=A0A167X6Z5_9HYPO|nr:ABC1 protein [Niveomyces insectorum RCEF 264]